MPIPRSQADVIFLAELLKFLEGFRDKLPEDAAWQGEGIILIPSENTFFFDPTRWEYTWHQHFHESPRPGVNSTNQVGILHNCDLTTAKTVLAPRSLWHEEARKVEF